jgi:hypothetical protein
MQLTMTWMDDTKTQRRIALEQALRSREPENEAEEREFDAYIQERIAQLSYARELVGEGVRAAKYAKRRERKPLTGRNQHARHHESRVSRIA